LRPPNGEGSADLVAMTADGIPELNNQKVPNIYSILNDQILQELQNPFFAGY
jgi:hypothetical protein